MPSEFLNSLLTYKPSQALLLLNFYFQTSTNVRQEHIIAAIMPCVTTPREDTTVPATKILLGMEKTVQVIFLLLPL